MQYDTARVSQLPDQFHLDPQIERSLDLLGDTFIKIP